MWGVSASIYIVCLTSLCYVLEAGVLKVNPPVFWPKRLPPRPREGAAVVAGAGVPKEKPPVLAAGALQKTTHFYATTATERVNP